MSESKIVNKEALVKATADLSGVSKADTERVITALFGSVQKGYGVIASELISGNKVQLFGFGTFETVERSARKGRNPKTGEEIQIEAKVAPKWSPTPAFKELFEPAKQA